MNKNFFTIKNITNIIYSFNNYQLTMFILIIISLITSIVANSIYLFLDSYVNYDSTSMWLSTLIFQYYILIVCFSYFIYTNESLRSSIVWITLMTLFGPYIACIYMIKHTMNK